MLGKPLWWALEQLGIVDEDDPSSSGAASRDWWGEYVVLALVERAADAVISLQGDKPSGVADRLYTIEGFRKEFSPALGQTLLGEVDTKVLLRFLERDRHVLFVDNEVGLLCYPTLLGLLIRWIVAKRHQVSRDEYE